MRRRDLLSSLTVMAMASAAACGDDGNPQMPDARPPSAACLEADTYQDLTSLETKIFRQSCIFSGCHNGVGNDAGRTDLREGMAHAALVNRASLIDPSRMMVVPGDPAKSYLLVMIGHLAPGMADPPADPPPVELMPQNTGGQLLCVEKRNAIERWITAGAADD